MKQNLKELLNLPSEAAARLLLGAELLRQWPDGESRVRIVETEAYHQNDAASHSYRGETARTHVMFGPAGYLYVYFTYGMHYCCNVVTGAEGEGSAVLIRAVEPMEGMDCLLANRQGIQGVQTTNGPAKLCQALRIDKQLNGHNLEDLPLQLEMHEPLPASAITTTTRVGISREQDKMLRFYITDNPYVSKL